MTAGYGSPSWHVHDDRHADHADQADHRPADLEGGGSDNSRIDADTEVVAYCRGAYCVLAHDAVRLLATHDRRASRLTDGILEWRLASLPVTSDAA